jgi:hypothetical protein
MSNSLADLNGKHDGKVHSAERASHLSLSSQLVHADDHLNSGQDVAPALHVSTTYRYSKDPDALQPLSEKDVSFFSS